MTATPLLRHLVERTGLTSGEYLLVLDGDGLSRLPEELDSSAGTNLVRRTATEIGVRRLLWEANGAPVIAVVPEPLARRLPADLVQGAKNARVQALETGEVLSVLLGRKVHSSADAWFNDLVIANVGPLVTALNQRTLPTVVNRTELGELLVDVVLSQEIRGSSPGALLARWVTDPPVLEDGHRKLLQEEALPRLKGDEGHLLAWALDKPADFETLLVTGLALTSVSNGLAVPDGAWPRIRASHKFREHFGGDVDWVHRALTRLAEAAVDELGAQASTWLERAESLARATFSKAQIAHSNVLPLSFDLQAHTLLRKAASEGLYASEVADLVSHRAAATRGPVVKLIQRAARLSRYLATADGLPQPTGTAGWVDQYSEQHAFADLVALRLRAALGQVATADLHDPAKRLLARWETLRNGLNERFARHLSTDWEAALHDGVVPLHKVSHRLLRPVLDRGDNVYLVVLDGCSMPIFQELVLELSRNHRIGVDASAQRSGLALLPSITSHSRGALFLGRIPSDPFLAEEDVAERTTDPARFKQNTSLGAHTRKLFLKGDLGSPGPLIDALAGDTELVAVVFNAVDDQITSHNTGAVMRTTVEHITWFAASLEEAFKAGRKVLLTADHGHTRWLAGGGHVGKGTSARWTTLAEGESAPAGFCPIDVGALGGTTGRKAFAWRMNTWLGRPHVGWHGGCSLEELVVPLVWLEREGPAILEPSWWHDLAHLVDVAPVVRPVAAPEPLPVPDVPPVEAPARREQLGLLDSTDRLAPLLAREDVVGLPNDVRAKLADDERAVLVLLHDNERVQVDDIHRAIGRTVGRIPGFMQQLTRKLHRASAARFESEVNDQGRPTYRYTGPRDR